MVVGQLRKRGEEFVVELPADEVERHGWAEGQMLAVEVTEVGLTRKLPADLEAIVEANWERNLPALRYLAER